MQCKSTTVAGYLKELPEARREAIAKVRDTIRKHLPRGYEETMQYGMIGYVVPHKLYAPGYHCNPTEPLPFISLASQKNYMSLYMMCVYGDENFSAWIVEQFRARGKKVDMGKGCIRFKKLDDLPLEVIAEAVAKVPVADYIAAYEGKLKNAKHGKK